MGRHVSCVGARRGVSATENFKSSRSPSKGGPRFFMPPALRAGVDSGAELSQARRQGGIQQNGGPPAVPDAGHLPWPC